jgi:hypothetical protein
MLVEQSSIFEIHIRFNVCDASSKDARIDEKDHTLTVGYVKEAHVSFHKVVND